eukprot:scaffold70683_cov60-Cyclotella_meneghiniana.AAC.2
MERAFIDRSLIPHHTTSTTYCHRVLIQHWYNGLGLHEIEIFCNIFLPGQTSSEDWIADGSPVYSQYKSSNKDSRIHSIIVLAGLQLAIDNARMRGSITSHLFSVSKHT